jgi:hypothetical protein
MRKECFGQSRFEQKKDLEKSIVTTIMNFLTNRDFTTGPDRRLALRTAAMAMDRTGGSTTTPNER